MSLKIDTRKSEGVTIISPQGRIVFGEEASALRENLKRTLESTRQVVLNLAGVSYIDSGGLGTLVGVYSSARASGAEDDVGGEAIPGTGTGCGHLKTGAPARGERVAKYNRLLEIAAAVPALRYSMPVG